MNSLLETGKRARAASRVLGCTTTAQRNDALYAVADTLDAHCTDILTGQRKNSRKKQPRARSWATA